MKTGAEGWRQQYINEFCVRVSEVRVKGAESCMGKIKFDQVVVVTNIVS